MKRTLISILGFIAFTGVSGQQFLTDDVAEIISPVNVALNEVNKSFTPPAIFKKNLKSGDINSATITVTYKNFPEDAKAAFEYAVSIWAKSIQSPVPINIHAIWDKLSDNLIGNGKPSVFYRNFKGAPLQNIFYPIALVEKITGREYNGPTEADIICSFNQLKPWYFGTNGKTPSDKYDFVTAVLHEIGHGLGISGFFINENGISQYSNTSNSPSIYDYFVFNKNKQRISDKNLYPCPSLELTQQLTSNALVFNNNLSVSIYSPISWENGISIYHFKKNSQSYGEPNELMKAYAYKGEAIHDPGESTLYALSELGWTVNRTEPESYARTSEANEIPESEKVNVYPNPFSSNLTFDCKNISDEISVNIIITDLTGNVIYREMINNTLYNPELRIDLSNIKPGIYLANITDSNLKTTTKRIIKN